MCFCITTNYYGVAFVQISVSYIFVKCQDKSAIHCLIGCGVPDVVLLPWRQFVLVLCNFTPLKVKEKTGLRQVPSQLLELI